MVQQRILEKNRQLLTCEEVELPKVARELQRLRVAFISLNELVTGLSDPTAKQEMGLLTKMLLGRTDGSDGDEAEEAEESAAAERLRASGIDPEAAENMARGLRALQAVMAGRGTASQPS